MRAAGVAGLALAVLALAAPGAAAFEAERAFRPGAVLGSLEAGGGSQVNLERHRSQTGLDLWYAGVRAGYLPWGARGTGPLRGAAEVGLEALYQRYVDPVDAFWAGLAAVGRYHFLALGRVVPYVELVAGAGGTDLRVREMDSPFAFYLAGGAGLALVVTDRTALYAGYRLVHLSNANLDTPNRGFEAHTGVVGVSVFLK